MNWKKLIFLLTAVFFAGNLLKSCSYFDEFSDAEKYPVVINCFFSKDSVVILHLSEYTDFQEVLPELNEVEYADVEFYENSVLVGSFVYTIDTIEPIDENNNEYGYYRLIYQKTKPDRLYSVRYSCDEQILLQASDIIPEDIPIISIDTSTMITGTGFINVYCKITFQDNLEKNNYYSISATEQHIENVNDKRSIASTIISSSDPVAEGFFNYKYGNLCYFSDENFNGSKVSVTCLFKPEYRVDGKNFIDIQLNSVSKDYYLYVKSLDRYLKAKENLFAEPVKIYSNVEGGYGIFAAFNKSIYRINLPSNE
ncbi:MAG: DUF4249 domain-containing protein [Bacteroidales bacterium]|nr:DUF4249 domain-containing protein [Bacteroidales bacterium]